MTHPGAENGHLGADKPADVDRLEAWAAAVQSYDEALAATGPDTSPAEISSLDADLPEEIIKARRCLERLARLSDQASLSPGFFADTIDSDPRAAEVADDVALPHRIDRFEIRSELGRGGQGVVLLAWDHKLQREVALKVPRPELLLTHDMRRRFLREGRAAAGLNHPHIVTIYEAGETGPVCFIAQEYCPGGSLSAWLKVQANPCDPRAAAKLVLDLADAVHHAHAHGILHRDLKPSNILLAGSEDSPLEERCAKITDFGLAKVLEQTGDETATGAVLGTAAYMPPEQATGYHERIGTASDVYGLGAILYELLTGRPPFAGASPVEIMHKVSSEDPLRPRALRAAVPRDLEAICLRCLEKAPSRRYATAELLAADLQRFLRGEPTVVRPATPVERTLKWARRRPWVAALVAVIFLSLAALVSTISFYNFSLRAALAESERSRQTMREHLYVSNIRSAQSALEVHRLGECIDLLQRQVPVGGDPDLRDFAWGYLWDQSHQAGRDLTGHRGAVYAVEFSPDGRQLVSAGADGIIRAWDPRSGALLQELPGHESEINALTFAPDGRRLASVSDAGDVILWSAGERIELAWRVNVSGSELFAACFSHDGQHVAVAGDDGLVRLLAVADGSLERELRAHTAPVYGLAFWQQGARLLSGGKDGKLFDWNLTGDSEGAPRLMFEDLSDSITALAISADESYLAVAHHGLDLLALPEAQRKSVIRGSATGALAVRFSNDGRRFVCANEDSTWSIGFWQGNGRESRTWTAHTGRAYAVALSPDETTVATGGADGVVRLWSADAHELTHGAALSVDRFHAAAFSADGRWMLLQIDRAAKETTLAACVWRDAAWQEVDRWNLPEPVEEVTCAISNDARWVVRTAARQKLTALRRGAAPAWAEVGDHGAPIAMLAIVPNRPVVVSASSGVLRAWDLAAHEPLWQGEIPRSVVCLRASARYVCCAVGFEVVVVDAVDGALLFRKAVQGIELLDLAIAPDDSELFAAGTDRSIYRWKLPAGQPLNPWAGHDTAIRRLAISPDGRTLAAFELHEVLKIWHRATGQVLLSLPARCPEQATFSPDGNSLHSVQSLGKHDGAVWEYRAASPASTAIAAGPAAQDRPTIP